MLVYRQLSRREGVRPACPSLTARALWTFVLPRGPLARHLLQAGGGLHGVRSPPPRHTDTCRLACCGSVVFLATSTTNNVKRDAHLHRWWGKETVHLLPLLWIKQVFPQLTPVENPVVSVGQPAVVTSSLGLGLAAAGVCLHLVAGHSIPTEGKS